MDRMLLEERLESSRRMVEALTQIHVDLVTQGEHRALFERLLTLMLQETRSEYGFIGEVIHSPEGAPYLRTYAISNIAWTDELRAHYAANVTRGIEFRNLRTLFGAVLTTGQPVLTNAPHTHPSSFGVPPGHPPLQAFLGVPFRVHGELVGMVGMANRPGGYDEGLIGFLQPLLTTCGIITYAWRSEARRREAEQALLAQQAQMKKLALVAARTGNAVIITDAKGLIEWVNASFFRTTGYRLEEVKGRSLGELLNGPDTDPRGVEALHEAMRREESITVELLNYTQAGRSYWNLIELQPVRDEQGTLTQWVAIQSDVTARRELEQQVLQSAERLRLALESAEEGMWDWDMRTDRLTVSPRWMGMLGYSEGMVEPTAAFWRGHLCHPEDLPEVVRWLQEHAEGRTPMFEREYRLRHKNGWWVWVLGRAKVVARDARGRALRMVGTQVDITSRKRAQEQIQAFIQAIPDMLFQIRMDGTCLGFKASSLELPAIASQEFIGKSLYEMPLTPGMLDNLRSGLERLKQGSTLVVYEYPVEKDRELQHYEARLARSGPDEAMIIVRNITERKLAEEQRRSQQEALEERVRQVTRELEARQAQLIQAEKLASLGQMAASIAHELNNPVGYVSSNVATLEEYFSVLLRMIGLYEQMEQRLGAPPPESVAGLLEQARALREQEHWENLVQDVKELLGDSKEGLARVREFVQSLKTFVREETGTPQEADLNQILKMTLRMLRHEFKYKCEVRSELAPLPPVRCFPTQLNQVFMNLLMNAVQAIEQRGEIHITSRQEEGAAVVRIRDTGCGMGPETLAKLFTPFFTTKAPGQGTGLGLSICYVIINRHQGKLEVESEPGRGTTFTVRLPLVPGELSKDS